MSVVCRSGFPTAHFGNTVLVAQPSPPAGSRSVSLRGSAFGLDHAAGRRLNPQAGTPALRFDHGNGKDSDKMRPDGAVNRAAPHRRTFRGSRLTEITQRDTKGQKRTERDNIFYLFFVSGAGKNLPNVGRAMEWRLMKKSRTRTIQGADGGAPAESRPRPNLGLAPNVGLAETPPRGRRLLLYCATVACICNHCKSPICARNMA